MTRCAYRVSVSGSRPVTLRSEDLLGDGGEALVFRSGGRAVKIFRSPTPERARKLHALLAIAPALPREALAPRAVVFDATRGAAPGSVVGFTMDLLAPDLQPFALLSRRAERARVDGGEVASVFVRLHDAVSVVHRAGIVIGDLSDQNELWAPDRVALVDVDSYQLPGFPCEVATEPFLDPRLFGPDDASPALHPGGPRVFDAASDWYAFAVLLFRSLTLVHPFGGVDPTLPTPARRARARRSVFSSGVRLPAGSVERLAGLPHAASRWFEATFEGDRRDVPREAVVELARSLVRCACGVDHERGRPCPACTRVVVVPAHGKGIAHHELLVARGTILALAASGASLRAIAGEGADAVLYSFARGERTPQRTVLGPLSRRLFVALSAALCVLERDAGLGTIASLGPDGSVTGTHALAATPFAGPSPAVAAARSSYRVCGSMVLRGEPKGADLVEEPVAQAIQGQTWIAAGTAGGREVLFLSTRVLGERRYEIVAPERVELVPAALAPAEALLHESAAVGPRHVVLLRVTELAGTRLRKDVFELGGRLAWSSIEQGVAQPHAPAVLVGERALLRPTDGGLAREPLDPALPGRLFVETAAFVSSDALIAAFGDHLAVARERSIVLLRLAA